MTASLPAYDLIPLPGEGPEDVVVGSDGLIYTGLLDGRILAVAPTDGAVREVIRTGGRPLGLEATTDGRLLICDSPKGLLELDLQTGALRTLVTYDREEPLIFCSNVVAAAGGDIFFTISSMRYSFHDWRKDFVENVPTGRVYRRAADGTLTRLMDGLRFANGLVLSRDGKSLIVVETAGRRLLRLWPPAIAWDEARQSRSFPGSPTISAPMTRALSGSPSRRSRIRCSKTCTSCRSSCADSPRACRKACSRSRRASPGFKPTTRMARACTTSNGRMAASRW
jgi:Strictosidine synthase/Strictosidine synthase-like, N-terminal